MPEGDLVIDVKQIEPGDRLTGLKLGAAEFAPLKIFLQRHAHTYEAQSLARTYGAFNVETKKVVGYITLVCGEVVTDEGDDPLLAEPGLKYLYNHYPAIKIARLAVDQRAAGMGLGKLLVNLALGRAKSIICPAVGCRFVMVDSKKGAVRFYEKCGFTLLDTPANLERDEPVMFVDLNKIPAA
ncbi:MAG: GNAT family N-acetyltransferase [Allosphingosinicella sp.]